MQHAERFPSLRVNPQYTGRDLVEAADKQREREEKREAWPYTHLFPPPESDTVNAVSVPPLATVPAILAPAVVTLSYRVPSGSRFIMTGIIQNAYGSAINPGDLTWTVFVNPGGGSQQMPLQGLINVPVPLGSFPFGVVWTFARPYEFEPLDLLQSKLTNVNSGGVGGNNLLVSAFLGFRVPVVGLR